MNAVDTNVYVYALDADEPVKQAKAVDLFDQLSFDCNAQPSVTLRLLPCLGRLTQPRLFA
jgi:predicted nucleic acid-binding protein